MTRGKEMKHLGLFEGIGGFSLAAKWMGWETVAWCEWNEFCQKILRKHFPEAEGFGDITKTDFTKYANRIDIITGGFPCQPYSVAGKRKGKDDDRHLWPQMLRAIKEIRPRWVIGENVPGLVSWNGGLVLNEIKTDLETAGFEVFPPLILPACSKNAPHKRERIWIVAHSDFKRLQYGNAAKSGELSGIKKGEFQDNRKINGSGGIGAIAHANNKGLQRGENIRNIESKGANRNEQPSRFFQSDWEEFPTKPPLCGRDDGIPDRVDRIKSLGNAVVPQVVYEIFKAIEAYEQTIQTNDQGY